MKDFLPTPSSISKNQKHDAWQQVMDRCYDAWPTVKKEHWDGEEYDDECSYAEFIESLSEEDARLVVLGNLNYQVTNGGFSQWVYNEYSDFIDLALAATADIGTPSAKRLHDLLLEVDGTLSYYEGAMKDIHEAVKYDYPALDEAKEEIMEMLQDKMHDALGAYDDEYYEFNEQLVVEINQWLMDKASIQQAAQNV